MAIRDDMYKVTLKSWLYERITANGREELYKGLKWIDEQNLVFQLPWVTENDPHWEEYYKLFHDWARRDGSESTDSQKAKRNFRSALNHSKHFRNLKEQGENLQTGSYKVYKFLTQEEISKEKSRKQHVTQESASPQQMVATPESHGFHQYGDYSNGIHVGQPDLMHGLQTQGACLVPGQYNGRTFQNDLNAPPLYIGDDQAHTVVPMVGQEYVIHSVDTDMNISIIPSTDSDAALSITRNYLEPHLNELGRLCVTVEYNGKTVHIQEIDIATQFGSKILFEGNATDVNHTNNVHLPQVNIREEPGLHKILENMKRGLHLFMDSRKVQINVRRDCLAHAYYFTVQGQKPGALLPIKRKQEYPVFSYETLLTSMQEEQFHDSTGSLQALCSNIEIIVGVQPKPDQAGKCVKGVKIILHSHAALKIASRPLRSEEVMVSHTEPADSMEQSAEPMNCD